MGVKHSKQSVDISSTPKKGAGPDGDLNGKAVEAKAAAAEEPVKVNGEAVAAEKPSNGDVPAGDGDTKADEAAEKQPAEETEEEKKDAEVAEVKEEPAKDAENEDVHLAIPDDTTWKCGMPLTQLPECQ